MALLRKASVETKKIALPVEYEGEGDAKVALLREPKKGEDFIEVRLEIAKRDFNRFIGFMPAREVSEDDGMTTAEAIELQKGLFECLVVGWSLDEPATLVAYEELENEGATAIDTAVAEHFRTLSPSKAEEKAGFRPE
jgi:hypothetical protein